MGSRDPDVEKSFGNNSINPSHLIASTLPSSFTSGALPNIKIIEASPIPVEYRLIRHVIPRFLFIQTPAQAAVDSNRLALPFRDSPLADPTAEGKPRFDFVLHIGMAAPRKYYTMETCAHRDGYMARDEAGESLEGDTFWRDEYKAPEILRPGFDADDVWRRWKSELMGVDVRPSNDAGRYLCDFIYYTSLVEYWRRDPDMMAPVMFLHVPGRVEDLDIETGRKVALELIRAMVESAMRKKGGKDAVIHRH
ncbi:MAG: hypothetical protein LQ343_003005 [Gyalolechia ehrenbergii]|nr:MAG: hypothetical protein LQ343_003005 [Gyalolechia ehrenbergii]